MKIGDAVYRKSDGSLEGIICSEISYYPNFVYFTCLYKHEDGTFLAYGLSVSHTYPRFFITSTDSEVHKQLLLEYKLSIL